MLVAIDQPVAALGRHLVRRDLGCEGASLDGPAGSGQRLCGIGILIVSA